jgi:transposase
MGGHNNKEIPYPADAPERAEKLYAGGAVDQAVAEHFGVSRQIVYLWRSRDDKFDAACDRGKRAGEALRAAAIHEQISGERPDLQRQPPEGAADQIAKLCAMGHTDFEVAAFFDTGTKITTRWKAQYPEIAQAYKAGKDAADERVERSLYSRATGYSFDAVKIFNDKGAVTKVPYVEHAAPDTVACIFWLKNRRPEAWRDRREIVASGDGKNLNDLTNDELDRQVVEALRRAQELTRQVGELAGAPGSAPARTAKPDRVH